MSDRSFVGRNDASRERLRILSESLSDDELARPIDAAFSAR